MQTSFCDARGFLWRLTPKFYATLEEDVTVLPSHFPLAPSFVRLIVSWFPPFVRSEIIPQRLSHVAFPICNNSCESIAIAICERYAISVNVDRIITLIYLRVTEKERREKNIEIF